MTTTTTAAQVAQRIRAVADPEIPVLTLDDLGIIRELEVDEPGGSVRVVMTPTYSGCPALEVMEDGIRHAARSAGYTVEVVTRLSPAWTTDWMSDEGRAKLERFGIAPPGPRAHGPVALTIGRRVVACPVCGSDDTEEISHFGATACKALRRCRACHEPFEEFKTL